MEKLVRLAVGVLNCRRYANMLHERVAGRVEGRMRCTIPLSHETLIEDVVRLYTRLLINEMDIAGFRCLEDPHHRALASRKVRTEVIEDSRTVDDGLMTPDVRVDKQRL